MAQRVVKTEFSPENTCKETGVVAHTLPIIAPGMWRRRILGAQCPASLTYLLSSKLVRNTFSKTKKVNRDQRDGSVGNSIYSLVT